MKNYEVVSVAVYTSRPTTWYPTGSPDQFKVKASSLSVATGRLAKQVLENYKSEGLGHYYGRAVSIDLEVAETTL